jgi:hypothetical protein
MRPQYDSVFHGGGIARVGVGERSRLDEPKIWASISAGPSETTQSCSLFAADRVCGSRWVIIVAFEEAHPGDRRSCLSGGAVRRLKLTF